MLAVLVHKLNHSHGSTLVFRSDMGHLCQLGSSFFLVLLVNELREAGNVMRDLVDVGLELRLNRLRV